MVAHTFAVFIFTAGVRDLAITKGLPLLEAGAKMPRLTVLDDSGKTVSMGDLLKKPLVLWFYPKDDTPG